MSRPSSEWEPPANGCGLSNEKVEVAMPVKDYKPAVGEKVFVSLSGNCPMLITVTGFDYHTYLKEDVMDYERLDGSSNWATYKDQEFFPEISTDTRYIYVLTRNEDREDAWSYSVEEGYFFDPAEAFAHRDAMVKGEAQSKAGGKVCAEDLVVEVVEVT